MVGLLCRNNQIFASFYAINFIIVFQQTWQQRVSAWVRSWESVQAKRKELGSLNQ